MDNTSGRRWARFALIFGAAMSVLGNETHTVLTPGHLNIVIRMLLAAAWPVALFVAVEVFVRVNWRPKFIDYAGRAAMLGPVGTVAAVVSYQHIHGLLLLNAEDWISALIGPVAIDGLMIGGTVALLAIRAAKDAPTIEAPDLDEVIDRYLPTDWDAGLAELSAPVSPAPIGAPAAQSVATQPIERAPRAPRATWNAAQVCELAVRGVKASEASAETGIGVSTYGRYLRVARMLREDPRTEIKASERVNPTHVAIMRELVSK